MMFRRILLSPLTDPTRDPALVRTRILALAMVVALALLLLTALLAPATAAPAASRLVDKSDPACSDISGAPYCKIQAAVDMANDGDDIQISADLYLENVQIPAGLVVSLSGAGGSTTAVDGSNTDSVFTINSGAVVTLTDMLITNGATNSHGGGIQVNQAVVVIERALISQNGGDFGGGLGNYKGEITVRDSEITFSYAPVEGGGILNHEGTLLIDNSLVTGNTAGQHGGGIAHSGSSGQTTILNSIVSGNNASPTTGMGGGIYARSGNHTLSISDSTINNNIAYWGGGIYGNAIEEIVVVGSSLGGNEAYFGGGIYAEESLLQINGSQINDNQVFDSGGAIYALESDLAFVESVAASNQAVLIGGGIATAGAAVFTTTISSSRIISNSTTGSDTYGGGLGAFGSNQALFLLDSEIGYNQADYGGGVYLAGPVAEFRDASLWHNEAVAGAGILVEGGDLHIVGSEIGHNKASQFGGGIRAFLYAQVTVEQSVIYENRGGKGAGLSNDTNSTFILRNSTVRDNAALVNEGGGIYNKGAFTAYDSTLSGNGAVVGGAVFSTGPGATIANVFTAYNLTIAHNDGGFGGGGLYLTDAAEARFYNTILAANTAGLGPDCYALGSTVVQSYGHNVVGDNSSCAAFVDGANGDQVGSAATPLDPGLLPLADNGGYALPSGGAPYTHALADDSPALDAADPAHCRATDQRGQSRNDQDGNGDGGADGDPCDVGAYEAVTSYAIYLPTVTRP